jgi:hypothetical protein
MGVKVFHIFADYLLKTFEKPGITSFDFDFYQLLRKRSQVKAKLQTSL